MPLDYFESALLVSPDSVLVPPYAAEAAGPTLDAALSAAVAGRAAAPPEASAAFIIGMLDEELRQFGGEAEQSLASTERETRVPAELPDSKIGGAVSASSLAQNDDGLCGGFFGDDDRDGTLNGFDRYPGFIDTEAISLGDGTTMVPSDSWWDDEHQIVARYREDGSMQLYLRSLAGTSSGATGGFEGGVPFISIENGVQWQYQRFTG